MTVSYICHSHLSGVTLPSAAAIPPCAETVCERVGYTFEITATLYCFLLCANCNAARMPAPPAPTITASNSFVLKFIITTTHQNTKSHTLTTQESPQFPAQYAQKQL